jgi:hypothetical protein
MTDSPATPRTQAGRRFDQEWPGSHLDRLGWRKRILAIEREAADWRERILAIEREAGSTDALRAALVPVDDAMQYAIAFMNDPEGLAGSREEWRDRLRDALHVVRALAASDAGPAGIDVERLARAISRFMPPHEPVPYRGHAAGIAAEYARLSRESDR